MANRYALTDEVRLKWTSKILQMIEKIENNSTENDLLEFDLSDTELNPYTLCEILEAEGFEKGDQDDNGWQMDFWIPFTKEGYEKIFKVEGTGITFELNLVEHELTKKEQKVEDIETDNHIKEMVNTGANLIKQIEEVLSETD